jgi:hypothetical protein
MRFWGCFCKQKAFFENKKQELYFGHAAFQRQLGAGGTPKISSASRLSADRFSRSFFPINFLE